jgi:hypothetical protein
MDTALEFTRLGVIYVHLIACCVAIGLVFTSDLAMVRSLFKGEAGTRVDPKHLSELQTSVGAALVALWISGAAVVALDASTKGWEYFANPKLHAKIAIVVLLTLNGYVLHRNVLPLMQKAGSVLRLSFSQQMLAIFTGAVSGVSWFYAAMLGIGRPLSWKYSLVELMAAYPVLIVGGFVSTLVLTVWAKYRASGEYEAFQGTRLIAYPG